MSIISKEPKVGDFNEIKYFINIYNKNGELFVELDKEGNIKTNIYGFINKIIDYNNDGKIIEMDHDLYSRLNSGINNTCIKTKEKSKVLLESLYYNKKVA